MARIFYQQCSDHVWYSNDSDLTKKYQDWMQTANENIRLVFAFDN